MNDATAERLDKSFPGSGKSLPRSLGSEIAHRVQSGWKTLVISIPYFWLLIFFLAPFVIVLKISLAESLIASPPFSPLFKWTEEGILTFQLIFDNFS